MTIQDILTRGAESLAADLKTALDGVYLEEEYNGRQVKLTKDITGYHVTLTNPDLELRPKGALRAVQTIKSELGL